MIEQREAGKKATLTYSVSAVCLMCICVLSRLYLTTLHWAFFSRGFDLQMGKQAFWSFLRYS